MKNLSNEFEILRVWIHKCPQFFIMYSVKTIKKQRKWLSISETCNIEEQKFSLLGALKET